MSQAVTPELRRWILDQVGAGHLPDAVLQAMATAGWQEDVALAALESTLTQHLSEHSVAVEASESIDPSDSTGSSAPGETATTLSAAQRWAQRLSRTGADAEGGPDAPEGEAQGAARSQTPVAAPAKPEPGQVLRPTLTPSTAFSASIASTAKKPMPGPDLGHSPRTIDLGDRHVGVVVSMARPRVVVFSGFLSDGECDGLVAAARPRMARSLTVENQTGGEAVNADRTSNGMFFRRAESELVARIETRIARLLHWPLENGEGVQVLHYGPGAEYKPHYDYFDPAQPGTPSILKRGGQRVGTLVMYLNNPERGGGTTFPDVGLEVLPQKGNAVFFAYDAPQPSTQTLHGGAPVLAGEKWVATKWLREGEFI